MPEIKYEFYARLARMINAGQTRSIVLWGNTLDLFWSGEAFVPLVPFLLAKTTLKDKPNALIKVVYELNGPLRVEREGMDRLREAWTAWKSEIEQPEDLTHQAAWDRAAVAKKRFGSEFDALMREAQGNATQALEFMRQLCFASRAKLGAGSIMFVIEAADILIPAAQGDSMSGLNDTQSRRISIITDWFCDPEFMNGRDTVVLIAESKSQLHSRVVKLPQVIGVEIPAPSAAERELFISNFCGEFQPWQGKFDEFILLTAGLTLHALRQMLAGAAYAKQPVGVFDVVAKVQDFIQSQIGEDVVEFLRPSYKLDAVVGNAKLKGFIREELIPRLTATDDTALAGCAVGGPNGAGKTFLFQAVAGELGVPILFLKNVRSQWYGQTDTIFERLRRVLAALGKCGILVDEADTQFGGVGPDAHETERRLTGKVQQLMGDTEFRGKVFWILLTARIQLLSPDLRGPHRAGNLIIPVLDPVGEDRLDMIRWVVAPVCPPERDDYGATVDALSSELPEGYSAASFFALRSHLKAHPQRATNTSQILALVNELIPADIGAAREYQTIQALLNCTRRTLLPDGIVDVMQARSEWEARRIELERMGVR